MLSSYLPINDPTLIFFVVLIVILSAPIVMGKLRIPHIIGMVFAGVLIGEHGLNILARDASFSIFGKVGLYYIMFLAGLEMDTEGVKRNKGRIGVFGVLTCLVPLLLTFFGAKLLLGYSSAASFLLGCIMASNTLIAYPIVARYGLQRNSSVTLSVGSSMVSLFLALVMLAALSASYEGGGGPLFWLLFVLKIAAFCALLFFCIPRMAHAFLRRYSDQVMQYIFVLAVMFLSAALSELIELEGIFGAFLSGLILNRYIPHVSSLMNKIEFIGNAIFIPYFLIGVGMLINIRTLFSGAEVVWVVLLIAFFGTFGKWLAAYLSCWLFRLERVDGQMMFGLTSAHAAGAIAMVMVGLNLKTADGTALVDNDMLNGVVIMILVTCLISTMVTDRSSRSIVLRDKTHLAAETTEADDEKILLCVKYPDIAPQLLSLGVLMRNPKLNRGLIALNVVYDDDHAKQGREQGLKLLEQLQQRAASANVSMQTHVRLASNIANGIKHAFRENAASEIIMGMHVHTEVSPNFWGMFIQSLYNGLNRQIILTRFVQPLNTLRRIQVAVPSRAEFEPGFHRWLERLSRMAGNLDCRIEFHGRNESLDLIREFIDNRHPSVKAEYTYMAHWNELPQLAGSIGDNQMLVVVNARKGTISYKNALDRLPNELQRYFSGKNLMIIFPDQYGQTKDLYMSFTQAQHQEEKSIYDAMRLWLTRKRHD